MCAMLICCFSDKLLSDKNMSENLVVFLIGGASALSMIGLFLFAAL